MKQITKQEAIQLLEEIGNLATVYVPYKDKYGEPCERVVLDESMVYNPITNGQLGMSTIKSKKSNAVRAMEQIVKIKAKQFRVHSNYYHWATENYEIVNE